MISRSKRFKHAQDARNLTYFVEFFAVFGVMRLSTAFLVRQNAPKILLFVTQKVEEW